MVDAQELLTRNSLHKPSKIISGDFLTVKVTVNRITDSANPRIYKELQMPETIEWE
jgi:hypothetical protein